MSDNNELIKKKLSKDNVYKKEQSVTYEKIINILGIVPDNANSIIDKLALEQKYDQINAMSEEIKTYYSSDVTSAINRANNKQISTIRSVLKHHGYKLDYKRKGYNNGGKKTTMPCYFIVSNNT